MVKISGRMVIVALVFSSAPAMAGKGHKAHEHGVAQLDIAIEGMKVEIEFKSPAESIYGFEHEAKSDKDKKALADAQAKLEQGLPKMFALPADLGCTVASMKVEPYVVEDDDAHETAAGTKPSETKPAETKPAGKSKKHHHHHGEHAEVHAELSLNCTKSPAGTTIDLDFSKDWSKIRRINVQVISDAKQKGVTLRRGKGKITL